ncbi:MAG: response regulator [Halobacteriovoraceae bacterium]|nr:response regulator [Halobacteriovoraceae bacterium]
MELRNIIEKYLGKKEHGPGMLEDETLSQFNPADLEKILIVDDDDDMLNLIKKQLECMPDYQTLGCRNELETLEEINNHEIEVGIIDVNLEALSGYRLGDYIRYLKNRDIPFIFISSDRQKVTEMNVLKIDNCVFLQKPFSRKELVHAIRETIQGKKNLKEVA